MTTELTPKPSLPAILTDADNAVAFAAEEFFEAKLSNEHTQADRPASSTASA
ncbi:MAG: hypothetical protein OYL92_17435 [Acidobacteriota bacterium]|nr:hypothetical protein [Acidobacteriota bacterium]MDE2922020.1 hypothetical protein [Acidobacteriota bacterium]MDE3266752.1 hypothetical protein [Acidobacteriota bacterium]